MTLLDEEAFGMKKATITGVPHSLIHNDMICNNIYIIHIMMMIITSVTGVPHTLIFDSANREQLSSFEKLLPESQGQNLALTVLLVLYLLDSGRPEDVPDDSFYTRRG